MQKKYSRNTSWREKKKQIKQAPQSTPVVRPDTQRKRPGRQRRPTQWLAREDSTELVSITVTCPGRSKEEHKLKAGVYFTLSIDKVCKVNEANMVIPPQLLSTDYTHHSASALLKPGSMLDRMEKTMAATTKELTCSDKRLSDLRLTMSTTNMTGLENATNVWHDWKLVQEERLNSIAGDLDDLQEEGIIPDAIHEHTTIAASPVVLIVLIILAILAICICKKFGFLGTDWSCFEKCYFLVLLEPKLEMQKCNKCVKTQQK